MKGELLGMCENIVHVYKQVVFSTTNVYNPINKTTNFLL
jgi:hypothetical protein